METQFERDHGELKLRQACDEKLKLLLAEIRKLSPDKGDHEVLRALNDRYRIYARERLAKGKRTNQAG